MNRLTKYLNDTAGELKHIRWPTTRQAVIYTTLVVVISALVALFLSVFDKIFAGVLDSVL